MSTKRYPEEFKIEAVNGKALNLNTFLSKAQFNAGRQLAQALDINNQGQITGFARNSMGYTAASVISAAPEPTTWSIFALGLLGMAIAVRGNKRAA